MNISFAQLSKAEKISLYSRLVHMDYFNMDAVFHDETNNFVRPNEPDYGEKVELLLRTESDNLDQVYVCFKPVEDSAIKTECALMNIKYSDNGFDYYSYAIDCLTDTVRYYFVLIKNGRFYFYDKRGLNHENRTEFNFRVIPGFKTPDWAKGSVMYQIYVDRFCNGDPSNDVVNNEFAYLGQAAKHVAQWDKPVSELDFCNFYGGDIAGIMSKIPYLKDLGVEALYLNPVFVSPSNHKYDISDYAYIDPHLGSIVEDGGSPLFFERFENKYASKYMKRTTSLANLEASNRLFCEMVELAHANGIKVIMDGVFNHCGAFNKWMDREGIYKQSGCEPGAYDDENSEYHDYFYWFKWPAYDGWWGYDNHPKLNYEKSPALYNFMIENGKKWVSPPFNADGWRLDVAADLGCSRELNHQFWKDFRKSVKTAKPDALILAEHYGDPTDWLGGDQWDTIMNYDAFMEPVTYFLTGMEKHSEAFRPDLLNNAKYFADAMRRNMSAFSIQSLQTSMNQLSNHDHSRFLTRTNKTVGRLHTLGEKAASTDINPAVFMEAILIQMTWPGAPALYYGDEAGLCGWTDPDNRRTYPWGKEDLHLINFHKDMISLRKCHSCLRTGSLEFLLLDYGLICFGRWDDNGKIAVILNNNNSPRTVNIPVWRINAKPNGRMNVFMNMINGAYTVSNGVIIVSDGICRVTVGGYGGMVLGG